MPQFSRSTIFPRIERSIQIQRIPESRADIKAEHRGIAVKSELINIVHQKEIDIPIQKDRHPQQRAETVAERKIVKPFQIRRGKNRALVLAHDRRNPDGCRRDPLADSVALRVGIDLPAKRLHHISPVENTA